MHPIETGFIEEILVGFESGIVFLPGGDWIILINSGREENIFPKLPHRLFLRQFGEGGFSPSRACHRGDTPFNFVLHGVLHCPFACHASNLLPTGNPGWINRLEKVGVWRNQAENMVVVEK